MQFPRVFGRYVNLLKEQSKYVQFLRISGNSVNWFSEQSKYLTLKNTKSYNFFGNLITSLYLTFFSISMLTFYKLV
jgi:hypothetical protein